MPQSSKDKTTQGRRYALCIGIGTYTGLTNRQLRYAVADAKSMAERLGDPLRGNFAVTLLIDPSQTTKHMLEATLDEMLNAPGIESEDMVVIYLSCHGDVYGKSNVFYILPSDAKVEVDGLPKKTTVIDIHDLTKTISAARVKNIVFLLDVCHSGGAGLVLEHLNLALNPDSNLFIIGSARHDQVAAQSSTLKHGIFTSCLLRAFEQKPYRSDGWLTISEIHSFVSEAINAEMSKLTGRRNTVQIQARSASVNPNLPLVKNPRYSPQSREFYEEVKKLLGLLQYEAIQTSIPEGAPPGYYVAEIKAGEDTQRVGIIPFYNLIESLTSQHAESFMLFIKEQIEQENLDRGLLVTALEVNKDVNDTLQKNGARYLKVRTYESIWKNLIDFKKYLQKLVEEYQTRAFELSDEAPLADLYISLSAERRLYRVNLNSADLVEMKSTDESEKAYKVDWEGDLEEEVKSWLIDPNPANSRLALLADYGSGKSTFCQHLAATLARNYLETEEHERYEQRVPLLIPLRNFSKIGFDLEGYLVAHLKQYCRVHNADAEALMKMAEAGLLLFMLDGFDEMASRATTDTIRLNIELFERLANLPRNKVLLTTRPEYFLNLYQEQQVLNAYPCLYLQPFDNPRVDLYLQKRVPFLKPRYGESQKEWEYFRQKIDKIHDLSDLVRRPVLLEMIIKTLPALVADSEAINRPTLYQRYLESELDRQFLKQRRDLLIDRKKRFEIMECIALNLYLTDKIELSSKHILDVSRELLTLEQQEEMEGSLREIVTCSFLIRTNNEYSFSHQSFLEYLVACRLSKDIMGDEPERLRIKPLTKTILGFLVELEEGVVRRSSIPTHLDSTFVSFDKNKLESWFRANTKDKWLSSNAVSILARFLPHNQICLLPLRGACLNNVDLSYLNLQGADLQGADLQGADLQGAVLFIANLEGALLQKACLRQAVLREAVLREAVLREANLQEADLYGTHLQKANLWGADLRKASLISANLQEADLQGADLRGADLRGADLRGANLQEADLREANLQGAELRGANLFKIRVYNTDLVKMNFHDVNIQEVNLETEKRFVKLGTAEAEVNELTNDLFLEVFKPEEEAHKNKHIHVTLMSRISKAIESLFKD